MIPQNGWFVRENQWMTTGGSPILGNPHIEIQCPLEVSLQHWLIYIHLWQRGITWIWRSKKFATQNLKQAPQLLRSSISEFLCQTGQARSLSSNSLAFWAFIILRTVCANFFGEDALKDRHNGHEISDAANPFWTPMTDSSQPTGAQVLSETFHNQF